MNAILKKQMFSSYLNMYKFFPKHFYTMRSYSGQGINKKRWPWTTHSTHFQWYAVIFVARMMCTGSAPLKFRHSPLDCLTVAHLNNCFKPSARIEKLIEEFCECRDTQLCDFLRKMTATMTLTYLSRRNVLASGTLKMGVHTPSIADFSYLL